MKERECPFCRGCGLVAVTPSLLWSFPEIEGHDGYALVLAGEVREMVTICPGCDGWQVLRDGQRVDRRRRVQ